MKNIHKHIEDDPWFLAKCAEIEEVVKDNISEAVKVDSIKAILDDIKDHLLEFHAKAVTDEVTGFFNQKFLSRILKEKTKEAKENRWPLSLIFFDIDFLKRINDTYGHIVGTEAIKRVAEVIKNNVRKRDIVARYGGDEFIVVCVMTKKEAAFKISKRIQDILSTMPIVFKKSEIFALVSFGIGSLSDKNDTATKILKEADKNLHKEKKKAKLKL